MREVMLEFFDCFCIHIDNSSYIPSSSNDDHWLVDMKIHVNKTILTKFKLHTADYLYILRWIDLDYL